MKQRDFFALAAVSGLALAQAAAQMHVVKKPETVVRAVGVYEWTGEEAKPKASRLVPVTLFIDSHLEDAGVYLARPVPFALDRGTIFELDQAGVPAGTLELSFARHLSADGGDFDDGWMGFGPFKPLAKETVAAKKKSGPLSKIEVSGGKSDSGPKFASKPAAAGDKAADKASDKTPDKADTKASPDDPDRPTMKRKTDDSSSASTSTPAAPTTPDDPDRPTMKRKTDGDSGGDDSSKTDSAAQNGGKTASTDTSDPDDKAERPTLRKRSEPERQAARKQHDTSSVTGVGSLNDDPDRPTLHRGKPASGMDEDDLPALVGLPADMHQRVAVSDAANRAVHDFTRPWTDDTERLTVKAKLQAIAVAKLAEYDKTVAVVPAAVATAGSGNAVPAKAAAKTAASASTPAARAAARRKAAAAAKAAGVAAIELKDEVLKAYTLSYGGAATYFYSATATPADGVVRYVSLIAQQEEIGDLRTALTNVTDAKHLDRTPQMRLVDVVDVEASNRASLLLDMRGQHSRQFALYRVIGAQAQQTFVSQAME